MSDIIRDNRIVDWSYDSYYDVPTIDGPNLANRRNQSSGDRGRPIDDADLPVDFYHKSYGFFALRFYRLAKKLQQYGPQNGFKITMWSARSGMYYRGYHIRLYHLVTG